MPNLHQLLKAMVEKGASDLHITTGSPPQLRIDGALVPDHHGRFRAAGTFAVHRPGPQLLDEAAPAAASTRFDGAVTGDKLILTITAPGGAPRKVTLVRNAHLKQVRCL